MKCICKGSIEMKISQDKEEMRTFYWTKKKLWRQQILTWSKIGYNRGTKMI